LKQTPSLARLSGQKWLESRASASVLLFGATALPYFLRIPAGISHACLPESENSQ